MTAVQTKPGKLTRAWRRAKWLFGVYLKPRHVKTVDTLNGRLSFDSKDRMLGRQLSIYGEFEYYEMLDNIKLLHSLGYLAEDNRGCVMDVGGYVGMISIGFLTAGIFDKAIAFEPNPVNFSLLEKNVTQNGLEGRLAARNVALSDASSTLSLELSEKNFGDNRIRSAGHGESDHYNEAGRQVVEVEALTLDSFWEREPALFEDVRLVWMDIQGHEGKFFKGARNFFAAHPRLPVIMEFWPYGLRRSGIDRDAFVETVSGMFNAFHVIGAGVQQRRDISEVGELFDQFTSPSAGAHLILIDDTLH